MTSISERYAAAASRFTDLVEAVPADGWDNPSPCEGWAAKDVLEHVVSTELDFLGQRDLPKPDVDGLELTAQWPKVRDTVQSVLDDAATATKAFDGYFGPTTVQETIDRFYSLDLLVHRWDLAQATGLANHATLDPDELQTVDDNMKNIPAEVMRTPGLFGPEITPATDADATTRLMNFLGRSA
jgi:uncharacterized protein (TIGR03086 family)